MYIPPPPVFARPKENKMAAVCPNCSKKTGMDVGSPDRQGWYKYVCQLCKYEWKSPDKP